MMALQGVLCVCSLMYWSCILLNGVSPIHMLAVQSSVHLHSSFCIHFMSPVLLCKSNACIGNAEQCALAFTHLLSSRSYHPLFILYIYMVQPVFLYFIFPINV